MRVVPLAIICGGLLVSAGACTFVNCPADAACAHPNNTAAGGTISSGGTGGQSGSSATGGNAQAGAPDIDENPVLPPGDWVNVTGTLKGMPSGCGNLTGLFPLPKADVLVAGVFLKGMFTSTAGSTTWAALGTGKASDVIDNGPQNLIFDPADPKHFWEVGIYGTGHGVYETLDNGVTFTGAGSIQYCDSLSVDFSDPARHLLLTAGHEKARAVFKSTDGGKTWNNISDALPSDNFCTEVLIIDPKTYLVGCGTSGGTAAIYRTTDAGVAWSKVSDGGGRQAPLQAADGSIYWATPTTGRLMRSVDKGLTWLEVMPPNILPPVAPIELPDGRIAAVGPKTLLVSANQGQTWDYASAAFPYDGPSGLAYSGTQKAFFIWRNDCNNVVLDDAVLRFDFDYESQ